MKKILLLVCLLSSLVVASCEYHEIEYEEALNVLKFVNAHESSISIRKIAEDDVYFHASNAARLCEDKEKWSDIVDKMNGDI